MEQMNADAAGIDIGSASHFVAVPEDRDDKPVREFAAYTEDLYRLADWLLECGIKTVAMESTGVYWMPLFQVLEERGFEVRLVDARRDAQAASGLSVADYAARIGVSVPTLYQWRRRLESRPLRGKSRPKLVEVALAGPAPSATDGMVVRVCQGRRSIEVPDGFHGDDLRRLVAVLESC